MRHKQLTFWPRAWCVSDGEGHTEIVTATCWPQARRLGAQALETDWSSVDNIRRSPEFDAEIPSYRERVEQYNWGMFCTACDKVLHKDDSPVWDGDAACCNDACLAKHHEQHQQMLEHNANADRMREAAREEASRAVTI